MTNAFSMAGKDIPVLGKEHAVYFQKTIQIKMKMGKTIIDMKWAPQMQWEQNSCFLQ